jgi:hypothetical protein
LIRGFWRPRDDADSELIASFDRFVGLLDVDDDAACPWVWTGKPNDDGYGRFRVNADRIEYAQRVSYMLFVDDLADDEQVDHTCRNRLCTYPPHLRPEWLGEHQARHNRERRTTRATEEIRDGRIYRVTRLPKSPAVSERASKRRAYGKGKTRARDVRR